MSTSIDRGMSPQHVTPPIICKQCGGTGKTTGVCMELTCLECDGVGWLPTPGQDLTLQLGKALTSARRMVRLLQAQLPPTDERALYQSSKRDGVRGHFTGD